MREEIIESYHEHLSRDLSLTPELFARLKRGMTATRMLYGDRELGISLRPHLLARSQYDRLVASSQVLASAFTKMGRMALARPELMEKLGLSDRQRSLALVDPGFSALTINSRLDAFVHQAEVKYVEYNAENPSSLTDQAGLNQILFDVPAMQSLAESCRLRQFSPLEGLVDSLLETYREWGGSGAPRIAILDWSNLPTEHEFVLLRNHFVGLGIPTVICNPDELEYTGGRLRKGDFRIDMIYKRIIIHEFLERYDEKHPLIQAYRHGDVCLINPFRCKILHKKAGFELLTDEEAPSWLTKDELEVIRATVPWTRRVTARKTLHGGQTVDLPEFLRRRRSDFVLKPNDDYGGHGIWFGSRMTESEWNEALDQALAGDYVAQELIELRTEVFPIFNEREWTLQPMYVDTNPFLFRGRVEGAMVRLSDSPVVNVTSGGGETGFFVLEGRL